MELRWKSRHLDGVLMKIEFRDLDEVETQIVRPRCR